MYRGVAGQSRASSRPIASLVAQVADKFLINLRAVESVSIYSLFLYIVCFYI
jgi:hypothetical protein